MRISSNRSSRALSAACFLALVQTIHCEPSAGSPVDPQSMKGAHVDANGVLRWQDTGAEIALFGVNY